VKTNCYEFRVIHRIRQLADTVDKEGYELNVLSLNLNFKLFVFSSFLPLFW